MGEMLEVSQARGCSKQHRYGGSWYTSTNILPQVPAVLSRLPCLLIRVTTSTLTYTPSRKWWVPCIDHQKARVITKTYVNSFFTLRQTPYDVVLMTPVQHSIDLSLHLPTSSSTIRLTSYPACNVHHMNEERGCSDGYCSCWYTHCLGGMNVCTILRW